MSLFKNNIGEDISKDKDIFSDSGFKLIPVFTEKSHSLNKFNKYVFKSNKDFSKNKIRFLVENIYKVDVVKINTSVFSKKKRTIKYNRGYQKPYKRVTVTLKDGQSISDLQKS